ncbi:MAG: molybdopterin-dependent oxidoreductase [Proteobacteria bacterium]|nr:molybdopterin-dependent oxidoreductase [Pseudomonadota bacterium]
MRINRRDFLKASVAAGATAALTGPSLNAFAAKHAAVAGEKVSGGTDAGKWIPTTCQGCTQWCPVEFFVQNSRAVKVRGNQLSKVNNGYCCPRGHLMLQELYDPDRIKVPMKRTNPEKGRGVDPKFVPVSWDEALDTIADKLMELRKNNEPHKFLFIRGRYSPKTYPLAYETLPKMIGSPNNISHSAICAEAEKFGPFYTEGYWGYRDYDLANMKCLVVWGCDPLSSNRNVPNTINKIGDLINRGTLITIDPRLSSIGSKSHEWVPVKPGEDGALATAIAHVILVQGIWHKEFVGDFKDGKNQFKAGKSVDEAAFAEKLTSGLIKWWNLELKDRTPGWAEKICGIPKAQIVRIAKAMGAAAPKVAVWMGPGPVMCPRGAYTSTAIHALNGLLGACENEGGSLRNHAKSPSGKLPELDAFLDDMAKKYSKEKKIDQRGYKQFPAMAAGKAGSGVITNNVATGILNEDPYDIKVCISYWANFNFSCTGTDRWDKAMSKLFYVHIGTNPAEAAMFADIVLPAAHHATQKLSIIDNKGNLHTHLSIQQPVVGRMWEEKADETEIMYMLAEKLAAKGFPNMVDYFNSFKDPETAKTPTNAEEFALIASRIISAPVWKPEKPLKGDKLTSWEDFKAKGIYNSEGYPFRALWEKGFPTPSKKFEFYSEALKKALGDHAKKYKTTIDDVVDAAGYLAKGEEVFVPHYEPPKVWGDPARYPFVFVDYKSRLNREGRSQNTTWFQEFKRVDVGDESWDDVVKINPADGKKLGIKTGDTVKLTSVTGSITVAAKLWEGVRAGTIAKCFGQGHWAYGKVAAKDFAKAQPRGGNNNDLMPFDTERMSGSNCRNGGFTGVRIEKV